MYRDKEKGGNMFMEKYPSKHGMKYPTGKMSSMKPTYQMSAGVSPAQYPMGMSPAQMGPQAVSPQAISPMAPVPAPGPMTGPTNVAPVRRVVHPTQYQVRERTTRYPIENIYPTHTYNVHNHVCEYSCCSPHTESHQDCYYNVNVPTMRPMRRRPF
jgi:hypothetical protein